MKRHKQSLYNPNTTLITHKYDIWQIKKEYFDTKKSNNDFTLQKLMLAYI